MQQYYDIMEHHLHDLWLWSSVISAILAMIKKTYDVASATQTVAIMKIATKTSHPSPNLYKSACCVFKFLSSLSLSLCLCSHETHNVSSGSTHFYVGLIHICYSSVAQDVRVGQKNKKNKQQIDSKQNKKITPKTKKLCKPNEWNQHWLN